MVDTGVGMRWRLVVLLPFLGVLAYFCAPLIRASDNAVDIYNAAAVLALAAFWVAFARCRPQPTVPWALIGVALAGWVIGDLVFTAIGTDPTVSAADAFYVVGYLGFIVATARLLRTRTRERDLDSALDATLIGIACFLFLWIGVIGPSWNDPGVSTSGRLMTALYPLLDVVLLFFLLRLLLSPGRTSAAIAVFVVAITAILVADVAFAALQQTNSYQDGTWGAFDGMWLVGYALMPIAVVLRAREDPTHMGVQLVGRPSRLAGLAAAGVALIALPTADVASRTTGQPLTTAVLTVSGGLIVLLVFARIIRLHESLDTAFGEVDRQQRYYRAVADNASDSFLVLSPDGVVIDAAGTLQNLVGYDLDRAIGGNALVVVHPDDQDVARALLDDALAHPGITVSGEVRVIAADRSILWMELFCTNHCADPAVGGMVVNAHDVTARKEAEAELEHRALHDSVTGLANRAFLRDRIERALARRARDGNDVAVLFCDLDGFKLVNDTIGHEAGDDVLRIAAARFLRSVRPVDTLARIGGDEFAVLIETSGDLAEEAATIANRLLSAMAQPVEVRGTPMVVTASIGIAVASRGGQSTPDDLLRDADTAMYSAKATGRNRAVPFEASMGTALQTRVQLGADLRSAIQRGELELLYQPIIDLDRGHITGFEALVRWNHPSRGLLAPAEFIGIAEENGTIVDIGRWVLHAACEEARRWGTTASGETPMVSVNVSGHQLVHADFVDHVSEALVATGMPAQSLVIELTESALVDHTEQAAARLRALKAIGVRVAIDDFGVGQSSLSYLRQFPVDILKLDRSFIEMITRVDRVPALIAGLLELARTLNLTSLAEGIETTEQRIALAAEGCELGQGYLFSRPVDGATAASLLIGDGAPEERVPA